MRRTAAAMVGLVLLGATAGHATKASKVLDPGYANTAGWVDVDKDGRPDFCRLGGQGPTGSGVVLCQITTRVDSGQSKMTLSSLVIDLGYASPASTFVQTPGDNGGAFFCRSVGNAQTRPAPCCTRIKVNAQGTGLEIEASCSNDVDEASP